jgi:hypothetical protein
MVCKVDFFDVGQSRSYATAKVDGVTNVDYIETNNTWTDTLPEIQTFRSRTRTNGLFDKSNLKSYNIGIQRCQFVDATVRWHFVGINIHSSTNSHATKTFVANYLLEPLTIRMFKLQTAAINIHFKIPYTAYGVHQPYKFVNIG